MYAPFVSLFFFNATATPETYTLSLHDALPIFANTLSPSRFSSGRSAAIAGWSIVSIETMSAYSRSEEHTSELQSHVNLVCRLLLEKKNYTPALVCLSPTRPYATPSSRAQFLS